MEARATQKAISPAAVRILCCCHGLEEREEVSIPFKSSIQSTCPAPVFIVE
jgi:hypothetical protein